MKNKNKRRILTFLILLVLFLFSSVIVSAWGVAPARQFADNVVSTQKLSVNLVNNDAKNGYFKVLFAGSLANYASYDGGLVYLMSDQGVVNIPFSLKLPKNLDGGKNTLGVVLQEVNSGSTNTVGASITLVSEVVVNVPLDGEFINADVTVSRASEFNPVPITISLFNTGTKQVITWAEIKIKGPTNDVLTTLTTEKITLAVGQSSKFESFWTGETRQGSYVAEVTLHYGSSFKTITKGFVVSGEKVVSEYISSDDFNLGKIVAVNIGVKNNWNTEIKGVYAEVNVLTKTGSLVQNFKSGPENLLAKGTAILSAYWDTSKLVVGNYDLNVILHFGDMTTQKTYPASVSLNKLSVAKTTGQVTGNVESTSGSSINILVLLLIVLIVVNVLGLMFMKKVFKKKK